MFHNHHIIPRHMGGSNDPSNLKLVSIKEHAEEHRLLYEKFRREEDKIAWLALSGQITSQEATKQAQILAGIRTKELGIGVFARSKETMRNQLRINKSKSLRLQEHLKSGNARKGKIHSTESIEIIKKKCKETYASGRIHPMKGRKHSPESIEKMRQAKLCKI